MLLSTLMSRDLANLTNLFNRTLGQEMRFSRKNLITPPKEEDTQTNSDQTYLKKLNGKPQNITQHLKLLTAFLQSFREKYINRSKDFQLNNPWISRESENSISVIPPANLWNLFGSKVTLEFKSNNQEENKITIDKSSGHRNLIEIDSSEIENNQKLKSEFGEWGRLHNLMKSKDQGLMYFVEDLIAKAVLSNNEYLIQQFGGKTSERIKLIDLNSDQIAELKQALAEENRKPLNDYDVDFITVSSIGDEYKIKLESSDEEVLTTISNRMIRTNPQLLEAVKGLFAKAKTKRKKFLGLPLDSHNTGILASQPDKMPVF